MNARVRPMSDVMATATEYPPGLRFNVAFEAFSVELTTLPDSALRFHIAEGPHARTETVAIHVATLRPGVFLVSWVEASGATVAHVEDFADRVLYSHATLSDGTFLRMQAPIHLVGLEPGA